MKIQKGPDKADNGEDYGFRPRRKSVEKLQIEDAERKPCLWEKIKRLFKRPESRGKDS
jgi:hypothetical protein